MNDELRPLVRKYGLTTLGGIYFMMRRFEYQNRTTCASQIGRAHQTIVAAADDNAVVARPPH